MKSWQVAAVKGNQMPAVGSCPAAHAVSLIQYFPPAACLAGSIGQRDRRFKRRLQNFWWQYLLAVVHPVVHQGDQPMRHVFNVGDDRAGGRYALLIFVIWN